jgi:hypothetical protein
MQRRPHGAQYKVLGDAAGPQHEPLHTVVVVKADVGGGGDVLVVVLVTPDGNQAQSVAVVGVSGVGQDEQRVDRDARHEPGQAVVAVQEGLVGLAGSAPDQFGIGVQAGGA